MNSLRLISSAASTTHAEPVAINAFGKGRAVISAGDRHIAPAIAAERHSPCLIAFMASSFTTSAGDGDGHDRINDCEIALTHEFMGMTISADPSGAEDHLTIRHMARECPIAAPMRCRLLNGR